jgi:endoglycosylceramidase
VSHPAGARAQIADANGRTIVLRGVNLVGLEDDVYRLERDALPGPDPLWPIDPSAYKGACPPNRHQISEPPLCELQAGLPTFQQSPADGSGNDMAQLRGLGFDFARLTINWSQLEPVPGTYSTTYLDRIAQVVEWAREQGIYVLLDMHQDNYSRFTPETYPYQAPPVVTTTRESGGHADGAPQWAVVTDGEPPLAPFGQAPFNAYVEAAFTSFWLNRVPVDPRTGRPRTRGQAPGLGLQDHYIGAMVQVARRFRDDPTVVGYEIMNEPLPGYVPPGAFDEGYLYPFYRRVIDAVTGVHDGAPCPPSTSYPAACGYPDQRVGDTRHLVFFEPMAARNLTDFATAPSAPFTSYPNLVYAPHAYTHVFTADTTVPGGAASSAYPLNYDQAMQTADAEARLLGAGLFIGEYGNSNSDDERILSQETAAQDRATVGSALWAWKGNCGPGRTKDECWPGLWSVYYGDPAAVPAQNLGLIPTRQKYLSRVWPRATAGTLRSYAYDPAARSFTMSATSSAGVRPGHPGKETVVYVPASVRGAASVTGAAVLDSVVANPDGSRILYVAPTGGGTYGVAVG